ncbi:uncharacterized protein EV420DRAFT_1579302 [Desarmillaria tabescens]|uniref:Uncharacterized protein n=1 Tax=Armillaria tabescens TaxID=1929756 RepID=A0AA39JHH3_ARMTA|nr:uncharacterized protein EV420DRAFT_1579302 [Desarmillaria tabescens]KAK0442050.1 hypothetical protein EV420DRAFT_1579302 [Desarmillaria tabescens]
MLPPSVLGASDCDSQPTASVPLLPPALPEGLIPMDVLDIEAPATRRSRKSKEKSKAKSRAKAKAESKAKSKAASQKATKERLCGELKCETCGDPIVIKEGRWDVCANCTYALLNKPEELNPLFRTGGQTVFKHLYPEANGFRMDHIDNGSGVFQALHATYLHYLSQERDLQTKVGLTHKQFKTIIRTRASRRAYIKFGMKPPIRSGEESKEEEVNEVFDDYSDSFEDVWDSCDDGFGPCDDDAEAELSDSPAIGEAGPSSRPGSSSRTRK